MTADYDFYTRLEPNHDIEVDDEGLQWVICPFEQTEDGLVILHDHPVSRVCSWSANADPEEVDCPVCEVYNGALHFAGPPDHSDGPDDDELPPIGGASHGGRHHISEYTPCKIPLRRIEFVEAVMVTVHEGAVASLGRIRDGYEAADGYRRYKIRQAVTAFFVCRMTVSGGSWSKHALCAGDINWDKNPYGRTLITDMPPWFRQLFLDEGWGWGGNWRSVKDAMHFSKSVNEGGDGWLYVGSIDEEDEMTPQDWEKLEKLIDDKLKTFVGEPFKTADGKSLTTNTQLTEHEDGAYVDGIKAIRKDIAALDVPRKVPGG